MDLIRLDMFNHLNVCYIFEQILKRFGHNPDNMHGIKKFISVNSKPLTETTSINGHNLILKIQRCSIQNQKPPFTATS